MTAELVPPHADPWAAKVVDLESLNAHATDALVAALDQLRDRARKGEKGIQRPAFVAMGPAGVGKTHLFGRLRRKLGPKAVLVHVRPLIGSEMTPRYLLGQIVQQLGYASFGVRQIDLVVGSALAVTDPRGANFPLACIEELRGLLEAERRKRIEQALELHLQARPDLDASCLERLFHIPFASTLVGTASLVWLGGRELDDAQAARAGVREPLPDSAVVPALRTVAAVCASRAPLLVVFDQLENLVDADGSGARTAAYGNLVAELVDSVRDLVIVQMGLDSEWGTQIEPRLSTAQRSRVSGERLNLTLPTPEQSRELLRLWVQDLPDRDGPFPWPFTLAQIDAVCKVVGSTPRMLLLELARVLQGQDPVGLPTAPAVTAPAPVDQAAASVDDAIARAWQEHLVAARGRIDEMAAINQGPERAHLLDGFVALSRQVPGLGTWRAESDERIRVEGAPTLRWIVLVHHSSHLSVGAAFRRLSSVDGPVLAIREQWREFPPTWKTTRILWDAFRARDGARWHWLAREEAARVLALGKLVADVRSKDVEGPDGRPLAAAPVERWIRMELKPAEWDVTRSLLGTGVAADEPVQAEHSAKVPELAGRALETLRTLRVASLERVAREVVRASPGATRASVVEALRANPKVRWLGETIVCCLE